MTASSSGDQPPALRTDWRTVRLLARLPQRSIVTVVPYRPRSSTAESPDGSPGGPALPIPPIAADFRTGIAIFSYADEISFGLLVDFDAAPDVDELAAGVRSGWIGSPRSRSSSQPNY